MSSFNPELIAIGEKLSHFSNSIDLIRLLYAHADEGGVVNPVDRLSEKLRYQGSPERLSDLKRDGFIDFDDGKWALEQPVIDFLDSMTGMGGEVNVQTIVGNRENLQNEIKYLLSSNDENDTAVCLVRIRRLLKKISKNIRETLERLDFEIRDAYMTVSDISVKVQRLNDHLNYLERLDTEVYGNRKTGEYAGLVPYLQLIVSDGANNAVVTTHLRPMVNSFISSLNVFYIPKKSAVLRRLRDYLTRIEKVDRPARKIREICKLYFNGQLFNFSNADTVLKNSPYPVQKIRALKLSLDVDLGTDDENRLIAAAVEGFDLSTGERVRPAPSMRRKDVHRKAPKEILNHFLRDVALMYEAYVKSDASVPLSDFAVSYDGYSRPLSLPEKLASFTEAVNEFNKSLVQDKSVFITYADETHIYKARKVTLKR